jgi:NADH dehydrogenase
MAGTCRLDPKNSLHIVIVGGGATGVELAGEIGGYMKKLVCRHHYNCSCLKIDLIECGPKVLSPFGPKVTELATRRLQSLGVNILENTHITKENTHGLITDKGKFSAKTVIWVAGIIGHALFKNTSGLKLQPNGKIELGPNLSLPNYSNVYVGGDNAATPDSGNALSALSHGHFIAGEIIASFYNYPSQAYKPILAPYSVPVGPRWAISKLGPFITTGPLGWLVRRSIDLWFFTSILPLNIAWWVFKRDKSL